MAVEPRIPSPVQRLEFPSAKSAGVEVFIKRDDLIHPVYGGNKYRKLFINFRHAQRHKCSKLVTFGGPFSNHVFASAGFCSDRGSDVTIYIRGETDDMENPILNFVRKKNLKLIPLSRDEYSMRNSVEFRKELKRRHPGATIIPEGGANHAGLVGCAGIAHETYRQLGFWPDHWVLAAGTGNTAAGIASAVHKHGRVHAVAALKKEHIEGQLEEMLKLGEVEQGVLELDDSFHCGGMARWNDQLIETMKAFESATGILLDPIYTAKAWMALESYLQSGRIHHGERVVFVHTGGMPGRRAFIYRFGEIIDPAAA